MTTYGVTMFGNQRHVMKRRRYNYAQGGYSWCWWAKCGADAEVLPVKANAPRLARIAKFPVCKRCEP